MKIAIASGKGGTGKTTVAVNLALALEGVQLFDCDVEEPNCNLFLGFELEPVEAVRLDVPGVQIDRLHESPLRCLPIALEEEGQRPGTDANIRVRVIQLAGLLCRDLFLSACRSLEKEPLELKASGTVPSLSGSQFRASEQAHWCLISLPLGNTVHGKGPIRFLAGKQLIKDSFDERAIDPPLRLV